MLLEALLRAASLGFHPEQVALALGRSMLNGLRGALNSFAIALSEREISDTSLVRFSEVPGTTIS